MAAQSSVVSKQWSCSTFLDGAGSLSVFQRSGCSPASFASLTSTSLDCFGLLPSMLEAPIPQSQAALAEARDVL